MIDIVENLPNQLVVMLPPGGLLSLALVLWPIAALCLGAGVFVLSRGAGVSRWIGFLALGLVPAAVFLAMWAYIAGIAYVYTFDRVAGRLRYETTLFGLRLEAEDIPLGDVRPAFVQRCSGGRRDCLALTTAAGDVLLWTDTARDGTERAQAAINAFLAAR